MVLRCLIFLGIGVFVVLAGSLLQPTYKPELITGEPQEELREREAWERQMLGDPASGKIPLGVRLADQVFLQHLNIQQSSARRKRSEAIWKNRGPWNVGGRSRTLVIDRQDPLHLISGGVSGGIWESMDGGLHWDRVSDINGHPGVVSISQDPRPGRTHIWYALSGEFYGTSASGIYSFYLGDGAFRSTDNGHTWVSLSSTSGGTPNSFTLNYQGGWRIAASPVDTVAACVYMATYGSIYRSKDTGKTWRAILGLGNSSYFTDVAVSPSGIVYASLSSDGGNTRGFFRSSDGWNFVNITPSWLKSHNRTVIEINPNNENEVYFLSELPSDTSGGVTTTNYEGDKEYVSLLKYTYLNGQGTGTGGQWVNLSPNLPVTSASPFDQFNVQGGYDLLIKVQPITNSVFIGGTNLYRSSNGFNAPTGSSQIGGYGIGTTLPFFTVFLNHHPDQHDLVFVPGSAHKAYSINDGGIQYTENIHAPVVEWQNRSRGYLTTQLYTVTIDEQTPNDPYLIGGFQDNGNYISVSNNPKHDWIMPVNGDGAYNYLSPDKSFVVMSIQLGRVVKVELDKHGQLLARRRIDPVGFTKSDYRFINPLAVDPGDNNLLYLPIGKKLARLNNLRNLQVDNTYQPLSNQWFLYSDTITTALNTAFDDEAEITALAVSPQGDHRVYIGTNNRELFRIDQAHTGDPSWIKLDTSTVKRLPANGAVSCIAIDPDSSKNVLICYSNYNIQSLFYSNDAGLTWYYVGGNLERGNANPTGGDPSIRSVAILRGPDGRRTYFAGTSIGLFSTDTLVLANSSVSNQNKTNWYQEGTNTIGASIVTDIKVRQSDGYVAIGTHGQGTFESYYRGDAPSLMNTSPIVEAYPVPASSMVYVSYDATGIQTQQAELYNIQGQRVRSLPMGINHNNRYTQKIDVSQLPNGHYFVTFTITDRKRLVKHLIVQH